MASDNKIILAAALMHGLGMEYGAWRVRSGPASDYVSPQLYADMARAAERGKLHVLFLAEQMTNRDTGTERPCGSLDTTTVLGFMAAASQRVGLVGTGSTTYNHPYDLARRFATLDRLAGGRAGWNAVTTANPATAEMFGTDPHPPAEERYARADEFLEVVAALWESWEADALVGDKERAIFADPTKVHEINHDGPHFTVRGPLPFPRSRQGRPVIFHAGSSPAGRDQAARAADVVFTAQHTLADACEFRTDIRARAAAYGRDPDNVKVLPGMSVILGATEEEAQAKKAAAHAALTLDQRLRLMWKRTGIGVDVLRAHLDLPFPVELLPPDETFQSGTGWRRSVVDLAITENLTVRELLSRAPGPHHHLVGTAATVADAMEERMDAGAADGFVLMIDILPDGLHDIADLLTPELQRRGIFHDDYEGETLRDSLGLGAATPIPSALVTV